MPKPLDIVVVVPSEEWKKKYENYIGISIETVKIGFIKAKFAADVSCEVVVHPKPKTIYTDELAILFTFPNKDLLAQAAAAAGGLKRKKYVIFLCQSIPDPTDLSKTNGASITGSHVSMIALPDPKKSVGGGDGRTWTHEIGHGLGLGHVGEDEDSNLMHPSRHSGFGLTGFELTGAQLVTMEKGRAALEAGI